MEGISRVRLKHMNITVLGDRVLVKPDSQEEKTKSGLFLPGTLQNEESIIGTVVSIGDGKKDILPPKALVKGAKVTFVKYSASEIMVDGERHLIVRFDDIVAVIG